MESRVYCSRDGRHLFHFRFLADADEFIAIYCVSHPDLNGQEPNVHVTHLFSDGRICIAPEHRPFTQRRAECLAALWAEHFVRYRNGEISVPDFSSPASE